MAFVVSAAGLWRRLSWDDCMEGEDTARSLSEREGTSAAAMRRPQVDAFVTFTRRWSRESRTKFMLYHISRL